MWDLENDKAMQMGLLSAGAAMLAPGRKGSAVSRGVNAGVNTYIPMMQWQERRADRKEDRNWGKEQDIIRNVLQERQFKMRQTALEGEAENRDANTNIRRASLRMQQTQFQQSQEMQALRMKYMGQVMGDGQAPAGQYNTGQGPLVGKVPQSRMGPRVQAQSQFSAPGAPQVDTSALTGPTDVNSVMRGGQPPQGQFGGMDPYDQQNIAKMIGLPGMQAQGEDRAEMAQFIKKELFKYNIDMSKVGIRGDSMGMGYIIYNKADGKALGSVSGPEMTFTPAEGVKQKGGTISYEDWAKQN